MNDIFFANLSSFSAAPVPYPHTSIYTFVEVDRVGSTRMLMSFDPSIKALVTSVVQLLVLSSARLQGLGSILGKFLPTAIGGTFVPSPYNPLNKENR